MARIKIVAAIVFGLCLFFGLIWFKAVLNDRERLTESLANLTIENKSLQAELEANRAALAARAAEQAHLAAETLNLKQKLEEVYDSDANAEAWAVSDIPIAVFDLLCGRVPTGPANAAACGLSSGSAGAAIAGRD